MMILKNLLYAIPNMIIFEFQSDLKDMKIEINKKIILLNK